jgi:O-antigen/teichoic acid export membrane protein
VLEPNDYGRLEFVLAAVFVGALVIEAGLGPWGARAIARGDEPASRILGRVLALRAILVAAVLFVFWLLGGMLSELLSPWHGMLLMLGMLMLVPKAALCEWFFQGRNEMRAVTATNLLEPVIALAGTLVFVHSPGDVTRVPLILAAAIGSVAVAQHVLRRRRGVRPDLKHGFQACGALLRESFPLGLSALAWAARFFSPRCRCTPSSGSGSSTCCRPGRPYRASPACSRRWSGARSRRPSSSRRCW